MTEQLRSTGIADEGAPCDGCGASTDAKVCEIAAEVCDVASTCANPSICQLVKQSETDSNYNWTMFGATAPGNSRDNPTSSTGLTNAQRIKAVTVYFDVRAHAPPTHVP